MVGWKQTKQQNIEKINKQMSKKVEKSQSQAVLINGDISLSAILNGSSRFPVDLDSFRAYCEKRMVSENLDFYV